MDNLNTVKLENQLIQSINKLLHQQPQIIAHERLNFLAGNFANSIIKKEANLNSNDHSELFPDALRYKEINFILPLKGNNNNLTVEAVSSSIASYIKEKYMDAISCGINSIGTAIRVFPTNEVLVIIFLAFFIPKIPEEPFREKFVPLSKNSSPATDFNFLINLLNNFREIVNLPRLTLSSVAEESQAVVPNMELVGSYETTCSASYAVEIFQNLLSDKNFNNIISDIWFGFNIKNLPGDVTMFKFWRKKEFAEYKYKLVYNPNPASPPNLDINKILGYAKSSSAYQQQKQRPGRKNPPSNQGGPRQGKGTDAWKDFSATQNLRQGNSNNNNNNNNNKNRGNGNWKKKPYSPRQQQSYQPQQQYQQSSNTPAQPRNTAWDLTTKNLSQDSQQQRNVPQQHSGNSYSKWKPQAPKQQVQPQHQQPQEQQNELVQQNIPSAAQQPQPTQQQPARNTPWSNFQPTEAFDDKNHYRQLPANMRISHARTNEQSKPQGKRNQPNRQQNQQHRNQNQQQNQQPERDPSPVQQETTTQQTESNDDRWRAIRNIVDSPYDDKDEVRKLPQELRRTHTKQNDQEKQRNNRRDRQQSRYSNQQQQQNQNQQQQQQPVAEPEAEREENVEQQNNSIWSVVKQNSPYDDSSDVRKLPPQLRRSHQQFDPDEKKKKNNKSNQERKEQRKQMKAQRQSKQDQKQQKQQQQASTQKVEEEPLKPKASSAWSNLKIEPPPSQNQQNARKKQNEEIKASHSVESSQAEEIQSHQVQNVQQVPETVQQTEEVHQVEQQQQEQQEEEETVEQEEPAPTPAKVSIWTSISEQLKQPPKKPQPQPQPVQQQPKVEQQQEPESEQAAPTEPEQIQQIENEPEQQNQAEEEEENAEPEEEVKSLAPPQEAVNVWAGIQSTKKYDDKNDYRKTPAEFRRSHVPASPEKGKQKKNQRNQKKQHQQQKQQQPAQTENSASNEQQQQQQPETLPEEVQQQNEPEQIQQPEPEKEQEVQIEKKSSWAVLPDTPYDDKYDMRKIPPELRRTHNTQPVEKGKKDKRGKKDKDWNNGKKKDKDVRRNPLIQQPEPEAPKEEEQKQQEQETENVEQKQEEEPVPEKKSIWSAAIPDTPYDDKNHLSKIPPQLRRTHKLNEEKEKAKEAANKSNREGRRNQNQNKNKQQQQNQNHNQNQRNNNEKQQLEEEAPKKNLSPWASFNITPAAPKPQPQPKPQQQQEQEQEQEQEVQPKEDEIEKSQPEPELERKPEPQPQEEQTIENEPAPAMLKKEVHQAWKSINLHSKS